MTPDALSQSKGRACFGDLTNTAVAVLRLLCCMSAVALAGCVTQPDKSPTATHTNSVSTGNSTEPRAAVFPSQPTNQIDWKQVAEVFHAKFHEHGQEENLITKLAEKIGEKVVDKEIEKGYEELRKKLFGGGELQGLTACCDQMKKITETITALQNNLQKSQSEQLRLAEQQSVVLTNLAVVTLSNARMAQTLSSISNQFYVALVLAGLSLVVSVVRLFSGSKTNASYQSHSEGGHYQGGAHP